MTRSFLASVPLVPVLFALDREADNRGRYWCPFHYDDRPGGKPSAVVDDDPTLFHCWSCGRDATAPEVVAEILQISVRDATRWCVERVNPLADAKPRRKVEVSSARLESEYKRHTEGIRFPHDVSPVHALIWSREEWRDEIEEFAYYVEQAWGWRGDYHGRVVMPHRDETGTMTGIKWRIPPDWRKLHRPGSTFPALYGSWRLAGQSYPTTASAADSVETEPEPPRESRGPRESWLCEGETDTAWGGYWLEPLDVRVLGLVGAMQKPTPEMLDLLRGDKVVLCFDDIHKSPGSEAVATWDEALDGVASEIVVIELPHKRDLSTIDETPVVLRERIL